MTGSGGRHRRLTVAAGVSAGEPDDGHGRRGAVLSVRAGEGAGAVRRGRRDRHPGADLLRAPAAGPRPVVHGREPRRRGRPDRRGRGGALARRRRDHHVHDRGADHHRAADERQGHLRSAQGHRADRRGRGAAGLARGQRRFAAEVRGRHRAEGQGQARQADLRHLRRRHRIASRGRGAVALRRHPDGARAVPRRRRRDHRADGTADRFRRARAPRRSPARCGRARCARSRCRRRSAWRIFPTCRPSPRSAMPRPPCCRGGA